MLVRTQTYRFDISSANLSWIAQLKRPLLVPTNLEDILMQSGRDSILLAEDEPLVRAMIATSLRNLGYNVLEASNGAEALQLSQELSAGGIQLLLSDIVMPRMNGIELSKRFRDMFPDTRILLMSGYTTESEETDIQGAISDPAIAFLPKPFSLHELGEKVREVLDE